MYANHYKTSRKSKKKPPPQLPFILRKTKHTQPAEFCQDIRISPYTFDCLVQCIENDSVFTSGSDNSQMPVENQLAITLYRFGHYGNAAGLSKVSRWAGVGKGTVLMTTRRVMTVLLRPDFVEENLRMPTEEEKKQAKDWVEKHSCSGWRNGWCLVDGTLVPLFNRPHWFGESYFDRKSNYPLNFQV
ncbi:hypothetical protein BT96DRAFT_836701 [Gymnopus androsaceus JB14]|uniref:DDE Tnp4 domain-containing protein n=1 Tax=Gymnopus androsaceus JB14 TaxID=1447944 RepID=A0A6A4GQX1_9AGAR|nr:hypothetical protein BT96DRAFT_836701 [Gymnopus androsaceus JB14]